MLFKDIDIFWQAAQAILQARDPYSIPSLEIFYPLPFYFLFIPLIALPLPVVHALWVGLQMLILVTMMRRRALTAMLSAPVLLTLLLGQVDIVMLALFALLRTGIAGGIALAFLALKPQLVLLLAPWLLWQWWQRDRGQIIWFALIVGVLALGSFVVQPDWILRFFARSVERTRASISSSLWGLLAFLPTPLWLVSAGLAALILIVWAWRKNDIDIVAAVGLFVSPFIFSYNLTPLLVVVRSSLALIALTVVSWIAFVIGAWQSNDRASALIAIAILIALTRERRLPQEHTR